MDEPGEGAAAAGKCLLVVDASSRFRWQHMPLRGEVCHVLTLGVPPEFIWDRVPGEVVFVDTAPLAEKAREALRGFVPEFYAGLPHRLMADGRTLAETLFPGDAQAWWLADLSEKSIFRGRLIERLYALALVRETVEYLRPERVCVELGDEPLARCLAEGLEAGCEIAHLGGSARGAANRDLQASLMALGTALEFVLARLLLVGTGRKPERGGQRRLVFFSFFPAWWRNAWSEKGRQTEAFFQELPRQLATHAGYASECAVWLVGSPAVWVRNLRSLRGHALRPDFTLLQLRCSWRSLALLFGQGVRGIVGRVRRLPDAALSCCFNGFAFGELLRDELLHTVSERELYRNLLLREAVRGLALGARDALIFRVEFQPFERALLQGIDGACPSFGFQHSSIGEDYLSHRFPPEEVHALDRDTMAVRFPSYFLCTGRIPAQIMLDNGFSPDRVAVCGAVRYPELRRLLRSRQVAKPPTERKQVVLVPVSLDRQEALNLAVLLAEAMKGREARLHICLKGHPANDHSALIAEFLHHLNPALNVEAIPAQGALYTGILAARALVMTGSTVGLEALALGVVPIVYQNGHMFSYTMSSLYAVRDAVVMVNNASGLAVALDRVLAETVPFSELRERWPAAVDSMLGGLAGEAPEDLFIQIVVGALERHRALHLPIRDGGGQENLPRNKVML